MRVYKIVQLIYNRLSNEHVPYFAAALVKGPNGGHIIIDEFTLQAMIRAKTGRPIEGCNYSEILGVDDKRYIGYSKAKTSDDLVAYIGKVYRKVLFKNVRVIIRDLEFGKKLAGNTPM